MKILLPLLVSLLVATSLHAHEGVKDPGVMARMHAMKTVGQAMKVLKDMAAGKRTFDLSGAQTAQQAIVKQLSTTETLFAEPHSDPKSEALPAIWKNRDDFNLKTEAALQAAQRLDVSTLEMIQLGLPGVGQGCLDCHKAYRAKK
jgi:cytochrome c556